MFANALLRPPLVAMALALAIGATACSPVVPPPASPSAAALAAPVAPAASLIEPPASKAEQAREKLLYPFNLPQYNDLAAELAAGSGASKDASSGSP